MKNLESIKSDCNSFFIGKTNRTLNSRFKENIQAIINNNT